MDRKKFIKTCGMACLGTAMITSAFRTFAAVLEPEHEPIFVLKSDFTETKKGKTRERKFLIIKNEKFEYPICLYKLPEDQYSALLLQCTHKGCELDPQGDYLICPCHGSEFNNYGEVQNPPAEQNLMSFKTTTDEEKIHIHI